MENECEALPGVAYPGVRDNRSTVNTKTGYDETAVHLPMCTPDPLDQPNVIYDSNTHFQIGPGVCQIATKL